MEQAAGDSDGEVQAVAIGHPAGTHGHSPSIQASSCGWETASALMLVPPPHHSGPALEEAHQRSLGGRPLREFAVVTSQVLQLPDTSAFLSDKLKRLKRLEPAAASTHGRHVKLWSSEF